MLYLLIPLDRATPDPEQLSRIVSDAARLKIHEEAVTLKNFPARIRFIEGELAGRLIAAGKTLRPDQAAPILAKIKEAESAAEQTKPLA
jgi:hypothetical protein